MDPTTTTRRRPIPRPWLEKRQLYIDVQHHETAPPQFVVSPASALTTDCNHNQPPMILLDKPDRLKSFLKLDWCWPGNKKKKQAQEQQHEQQQQLESTPSSHYIYHSNQHYQETTPATTTRQRTGTDSSFLLTPRPTVIYVIHGNPATMPESQEDADKWHQSYLSLATPQRVRKSIKRLCNSICICSPIMHLYSYKSFSFLTQPKAIRDRISSFDTSMTSLSCDDSLAFSERQPRNNNNIPRPSLRKSQTSTGLPPMAPSPLARPKLSRASTTGSNASHRRRSPRLSALNRKTVDRSHSNYDYDDDDDDDDDSTIASSDESAPIFPLLQERRFSSPRSKMSEKPDAHYLPKCKAFDDDDCLISGWVAFSLGDSLMHKNKLGRKHLCYLVITDSGGEIHFKQPSSSSSATHTNTGEGSGENEPVSTTLKLPNNNGKLIVETVESQGGRSVVILQNRKILLTLLPVNLPPSQFGAESGKVLRQPFRLGEEKSVAQHDAALHLWFGLDGWMRRRQQQQQI